MKQKSTLFAAIISAVIIVSTFGASLVSTANAVDANSYEAVASMNTNFDIENEKPDSDIQVQLLTKEN